MRRPAFFALALAACSSTWGLDAVDGMKTPPDPPVRCGAVISAAPAITGCPFGAGARATDSLGLPADASIPIRHVIILMKENRSFDHLLGKLHDRGQPGVEPIPASFSNLDANGRAVSFAHASTTCIPFDANHQAPAIASCIDDGKMDGFVKNAAATTSSDGSFTMTFYDDTDLPFYYWLARTYAVADRDFSPMAGGTFANRDFMMFGTNAGVVDTGIVFPPPSTPSIFQLLMNAGLTWGVYSDGGPLSGTLDWKAGDPGVHPLAQLFTELDAGTLPNVAFVDGRENIEDDHPLGDLQVGEAWLKAIYDRAIASPQWQRLAMLWTYDEAGAFADHVPPPSACRAGDSPFTQMGPRVPLVAISPWAKRNYVSHVTRDHTAITRFIEALFGLPALTGRDANSDALLDMFDFSCGRDLSVGAPPSPGTGGCPNPSPPGAD